MNKFEVNLEEENIICGNVKIATKETLKVQPIVNRAEKEIPQVLLMHQALSMHRLQM